MGDFFAGLIAGILLSVLVVFIRKKVRRPSQSPDMPDQSIIEHTEGVIDSSRDDSSDLMSNRQQFVAVVAASIASYLDKSNSGLRIHSIRRLSVNNPERQKFIAAVSAALAAAIGTEPEGLRIHSIRRLPDGGDRKQLIAAMSVAIATVIGTEVSGLRVHSINQKSI